jgi:hypothetical protein
MKDLVITLIVDNPDTVTGAQKSTHDRRPRLFSADVTHPIEPYADLIDFHRERWVVQSHDLPDAGGLTPTQHRDSLTLFQDAIAPVLDRSIPDPPWPTPVTDLTGASV